LLVRAHNNVNIMNEPAVVSATSGASRPHPMEQVVESATHAPAVPSQLISFAIGDDQYGVDIMAVREIKGWTEITPLPRQPDHVRGVLNLRGIIVPIVDLRCRFGQGLTKTTPLHIVIIVDIDAKPIGLLADRVLDIVSLDEMQVKPVPRVQGQRLNLLCGLVANEDTMIALIDLSNLLSAVDDGDDIPATETKTVEAAQQN
jgi:purine-binding chemotaxis protein CheW